MRNYGRHPRMKAGDQFKTTKSGMVEVIKYHDCKEVEVKFLDTGNTGVFRADNIRLGNVKDTEDSNLASLAAGTIHPTKNHGEVQVVEYRSFRDITVLFMNYGTFKTVMGTHIRRGHLTPP